MSAGFAASKARRDTSSTSCADQNAEESAPGPPRGGAASQTPLRVCSIEVQTILSGVRMAPPPRGGWARPPRVARARPAAGRRGWRCRPRAEPNQCRLMTLWQEGPAASPLQR
jgi:hypothetical protein